MKIILSIFISMFVFINIQSDFPIIIGELEPNIDGLPSEPLYIGISDNTISIDMGLQRNFEWEDNRDVSSRTPKYQSTEEAKVEILVNIEVDLTKKELDYKNELIPVLIRNIQNDTIIVGSTNRIPIDLEAMNENGVWQNITKRFLRCGTGVYPILLYPNHVALTCFELPKEGDYYATLRIKLGQNYSEEFGGIIQKSWFEERRFGN